MRRRGYIVVPVHCGEWTTPKAKFYVLDDGPRQCRLLGANIMPPIGLVLVQKPSPLFTDTPMVIAPVGESSLFPLACKHRAKTAYPSLFTRTGRFRNHVLSRTKFKQPFRALQQKGHRAPIALQQRVADELRRLIAEGHVERLQNCTDDLFVSPIVIIVKRDGSLKLALDSKELNKQIIKTKYLMPNIEDLLDRLAEIIQSGRPGSVRFSKISLRYAYGQLKLALETAQRCNFSVSGGEATGTYRFVTHFYDLSDMPAELQQAIDRTLENTLGTSTFHNDILI